VRTESGVSGNTWEPMHFVVFQIFTALQKDLV
jgi:hypothetical protein